MHIVKFKFKIENLVIKKKFEKLYIHLVWIYNWERDEDWKMRIIKIKRI